MSDTQIEITPQELKTLPQDSYQLIDTRDDASIAYGMANGAIHIPQEAVVDRLTSEPELLKGRTAILYCARGILSMELASELNRRGIKNAVLTNKPNAVACTLIDRFFGDAMELCVGQTPETISKPDPHSMDSVLERLGIPREQILYVGDTDVDMQTARNTQTAAAAAAWGYQTLEMLLPYHPEFIVRRPEQLLTIF